MSAKIIHLRYCRIVFAADPVVVRSEGAEYRLSFTGEFPAGKGFAVQRMDGNFIASDFLLWLSIYTGEDALNPFQEIDTRFVWHRGDFRLDTEGFQRFLTAVERAKHRRWPRWRRELFDNALVYFSAAARAGVNMMPLNLGLFALSLECLGNVRHGKRDRHFTFGEKHFVRLLTARLVPLKKDPDKKANARAFEKALLADMEIIHRLRNAFYGHSLLHLKADRDDLIRHLRKWMVRNGHSTKFANLSFRATRLREDVVRESFALYKLGLSGSIACFCSWRSDFPAAFRLPRMTGECSVIIATARNPSIAGSR